MRITLLIPCHNEATTLERSIQSWLSQSRPIDEIIVVDDASTDETPAILARYQDKLTIKRTPRCTGNKSGAQEYGLQFVRTEVFAATDGDTILDSDFIKRIEEGFADQRVAAISGYVKSIPHNWITECRALDYAIGQHIDKTAQAALNFVFVIPGAAGAFRTDIFRKYIGFDHDTLTEDLDFTYKLHKHDLRIIYDKRAICYTQDPPTFRSYVNQMRRWYAGGWQCMRKHRTIPHRAGMGIELAFLYVEGLLFSILMFVVPLLNFMLFISLFSVYIIMVCMLAIFAVTQERRPSLISAIPAYIFLKYITAYIYLEQFTKEVLLGKKNLVWFKPERVAITV